MLSDVRLAKLAKNLINYSCAVKKGENVLIEYRTGVDYQFIAHLIREVYAAGAYPFVSMGCDRVSREILKGMSEDLADTMLRHSTHKMKDMQAYIGIRGFDNAFELSDVDADIRKIYDTKYSGPITKQRVENTKWVVLRYPTPAMSQQSKMSTEAFEDFYFDVCGLDYAKMSKAMDPLVELMNKTDRVRLTAKDTDLTFSIKDIAAIKCAGLRNIPDGEIFTAPVKDSVEGTITFNAPSIEKGKEYNGVSLTFKKGKIVEAKANTPEATKDVNAILDTDEGARYTGEFALGVNPHIKKPTGDILFDEKISGSIHFTPGSCYEETDNGNKSAVHWDLVLMQTKEYGGGEIYFDDKLVRKDGFFVLKELQGLNPDGLVGE